MLPLRARTRADGAAWARALTSSRDASATFLVPWSAELQMSSAHGITGSDPPASIEVRPRDVAPASPLPARPSRGGAGLPG